MAIVTENDQQMMNAYAAIVANGFGVGVRTSPDLATYRNVMQQLDDAFIKPKGVVGVSIGSFEAAQALRPGLTASIAIPKGPGPFPILVHAHGHGLRAAHASTYEYWMRTMASYGFVIVFPDYRLQPESTYEDQVDDMMFAVRWAKENARSIKGEPSQLLLGGDSAGCRLSFDVMVRHLENPSGERFRSFVCVDGQMNGTAAEALLAKITPETPLPPVYMEVGSADLQAGLPVLAFAQKLMQVRKNFQLDVTYGMGHDFVKMPKADSAKETNRRMMEFLKKTL